MAYWMTKYVIFTNDEALAERVAFSILRSVLNYDPKNLLSYTHNKHSFEMHTPDHTIVWYRPVESCHGVRCDKLYVDIRIPFEVVRTVLIPTLRGGKSDVHFFYNKELYESVGADIIGV